MTYKIYLVYEESSEAPLYVGATKQIEIRMRQHDRKLKLSYDWNYIVLEEIQSHDPQNWGKLEDFWIDFFKEFCLIENKAKGGNSVPEFGSRLGGQIGGKSKRSPLKNPVSSETRAKMSLVRKGVPKSRKFKEKNSNSQKISEKAKIARQNRAANGGKAMKRIAEIRIFMRVTFQQAREIYRLEKISAMK